MTWDTISTRHQDALKVRACEKINTLFGKLGIPLIWRVGICETMVDYYKSKMMDGAENVVKAANAAASRKVSTEACALCEGAGIVDGEACARCGPHPNGRVRLP